MGFAVVVDTVVDAVVEAAMQWHALESLKVKLPFESLQASTANVGIAEASTAFVVYVAQND